MNIDELSFRISFIRRESAEALSDAREELSTRKIFVNFLLVSETDSSEIYRHRSKDLYFTDDLTAHIFVCNMEYFSEKGRKGLHAAYLIDADVPC